MNRFAAIVIAILVASPCLATVTMKYKGTVTNVVDGDTILIDVKRSPNPNDPVKMKAYGPVELDGVDTPELDQPGGEDAKQFLAELLIGQEVVVVELTDTGTSRGAWVTLDGKCVNLLLVQRGHAWLGKFNVHRQRTRQAKLPAALGAAQEKKIGVWKQDAPIVPSEWMKRKEKTANNEIQPTK